MEADPPIVAPNSGVDPERDQSWFTPLYELTRARLAMPTKREPHSLTSAVRVAVLDTAADTPNGYLDPVGHGRAVSQLVRELACGELSSCATEITQLPALPFVSRPGQTLALQPQDAGAVGTRGILAAKIEQASSSWASGPTNAKPRQLVINLSVGWSGCWEREPSIPARFEDLLSTRRDLGSNAVVTALGRAVCRGALVVAAAGNGDAQATCPSKRAASSAARHMFPGLWGGVRIDSAACSALGIDASFDEPRPLVVGVGAVDDVDRQLAITDHEADLVAYGQGVIVRDSTQANGWTLALSGTSMSAAAFSGIAAALWSYTPSMKISEIIATITKSSVPLRAAPLPGDPGADDFVCNQTWSGASCPLIQRLSLCGALGKYAYDCTTPLASKESSAAFATMSPLAPSVTAVDCAECELTGTCPELCDEEPDQWSALEDPWVTPQPKPPACGTCVFVPGLTPLFQAEFLYGVGSLLLYVNRPNQPEPSKYVLSILSVPALLPTTWLLPLSASNGTSAYIVYRASASLAKESGDVLLQSVPPFSIVSTILGGP